MCEAHPLELLICLRVRDKIAKEKLAFEVSRPECRQTVTGVEIHHPSFSVGVRWIVAMQFYCKFPSPYEVLMRSSDFVEPNQGRRSSGANKDVDLIKNDGMIDHDHGASKLALCRAAYGARGTSKCA